MTTKQPIIFCDFDGTITNSDNIIAIMKEFAPPEWDGIKNQVLAQEVSIKEGVGKMFALLPSSKKQDIKNFIMKHAEIREGFAEFVSYAKEKNIPLYVVSGGIDFFVEPILASYISSEDIYCNSSDFSQNQISIVWPHTCDNSCENDCGCCKPTIIRSLCKENDRIIVIGDSITDLEAARLADQVIARDFLADKCKNLGIPFSSFETFFDVMEILKKSEVRA
ncbi:2-hydroxy-3-keto-5-methylthiopentenyl-1-phosphate phosphatase [Bacillus sp. THAF10]|uniref:2-hydroxy-3-keto-5-methylthiopentenyl-1- phosphate phosphatase n=1 Tax=Bacillus sp. THAF10 TaxID=2587848 RepID=UPI0012691CCC|nr:2-hydroxy-3-keto-5-methylthiopentenyl-1-phosphate phosphatase [Bacillus sp. THAF10]QFT88515.1 2-hydroxy-3-keto-5-methylthiopentenyl-1-phosphate phosphatase [Bacillus sp. THAF10]